MPGNINESCGTRFDFDPYIIANFVFRPNSELAILIKRNILLKLHYSYQLAGRYKTKYLINYAIFFIIYYDC